MADINLLNNELKKKGPFSLSGKAGLWSFYIALGLLGLLILVYVGLKIYQGSLDSQIKEVRAQAADVNLEISQMDEERLEAIAVQKRLQNLRVLLESHLLWSPVFDELEDFTLTTADYSGLAASEAENKLTLSGIAGSFTDLAKVMRGLELSENIEKVELVSSSRSQGAVAGIEFSLEVTFDEELLKNDI